MHATADRLERVERVAAAVLDENARGWPWRCEPDPTQPRDGEPPVRILTTCADLLLVLCRLEQTVLLSDETLAAELRHAWLAESTLIGPI
jgi:hypothetical protein